MQLWRISDYHSLAGLGGLRASARWHTKGSRIVYLAATPTGSLLEVLVHLDFDEGIGLPTRYTLLQIEVPDALPIETLAEAGAHRWRSALRVSRRLGDAWLKGRSSVLARVPSSVLPFTWNYLFNPVHPDADQVRILSATTAEFDPRLLGRHKSRAT